MTQFYPPPHAEWKIPLIYFFFFDPPPNITVNVVCAPKDLKYCDLELQRKMKLNILGFQSKDLQHM